MERCPVCRARFKQDPVCSRCGADLSSLLAIETEAAALERQAVVLLGVGQWIEARQAADRALALQHSPLALAVREFARRELLDRETGLIERLLQ
ncbi:MAG: hypothetical protein IPL59_08950 [Candidatus Competibacteraceae bacterium]|nr:hypothetical protein [Candidatus Contendobacter odensis]MBK8535243.1 hypothetical protein [Candidatus Competibacteraceae bacterium]MBK8752906.1 hypothetical protein [Candidatus Competibacteraceae bacterium]